MVAMVRSAFSIITFPFTLAFMATLVLALMLAFVAPFEGRVFTFVGCNGEGYLELGGRQPVWSF